MAFVKATTWLVGSSVLGFFLFKTITPNEENYAKELQKYIPTGPKDHGRALDSTNAAPQNITLPKAPPTANPFYPALKTESGKTDVSKQNTDSRKTSK